MKKIIAILSAFILAFTLTLPVLADTPKVTFNGVEMEFETAPYIKNDFTMVPFRAIFEAMGAVVGWDEESRSVMGYLETENELTAVGMQIGLPYAIINGEMIDLDIPAEITNDFTFVPIRFVAENLGANVEWDHENYTVVITTK